MKEITSFVHEFPGKDGATIGDLRNFLNRVDGLHVLDASRVKIKINLRGHIARMEVTTCQESSNSTQA